jgi:hypothetical protein
MAPGVRNLHEDSGDKLHGVDPLRLCRLRLVVSRLGGVDDLGGAGGEVQAGEAHRGAHHVADESLELPSLAGMDEDPVVHGEAASPPRIEQLDPLLAQQPSAAEKGEHLVAEELLGRSFVHIRLRDPLPRSRPAAPGNESVDVGVELRSVAEGLDHRHHPRAKLLLLDRRRHELLAVLYSRPAVGLLSDVSYVLLGSVRAEAPDFEAICENLQPGMAVYFH